MPASKCCELYLRDDCMECGALVCENCGCCQVCDKEPEPTQWERYSTEFDTTRYLEWVDYANQEGFAIQRWLKRWYEASDLVHAISIRESPLMARIRERDADREIIATRLVEWPCAGV